MLYATPSNTIHIVIADRLLGCDNSVNANNSATYGQLKPDTYCQQTCRGNTNEICGSNVASNLGITIYRYAVSGFVDACVLVLCALYCYFPLYIDRNLKGRLSSKTVTCPSTGDRIETLLKLLLSLLWVYTIQTCFATPYSTVYVLLSIFHRSRWVEGLRFHLSESG